jgi:hypothetical protein
MTDMDEKDERLDGWPDEDFLDRLKAIWAEIQKLQP